MARSGQKARGPDRRYVEPRARAMELAAERRMSAPRILEELRRAFPAEAVDLDPRTVRRWIAGVRVLETGTWDWRAAPPGQAALILPYLARMSDQSGGEVRNLSPERAAIIERLLTIAPDLDDWRAFVLAGSLLRDEDGTVWTAAGDYLAWGPWRSTKAYGAYVRAVEEGRARTADVAFLRSYLQPEPQGYQPPEP